MFADYEYYKSTFKGIKITSDDEYKYLGQQASLYIKKYTEDVNDNTKACECAIAEYLQSSIKQGNMTSESIPNFYSASWSANDNKTRMSEINAILELYLGCKYSSVGIVKVIG
jgi:hypothetical protein